MGSSDRKPFETATVLDQAFLDECFGNLTNQLEIVVDIEAPFIATYTNPSGNLVEVTTANSHGLSAGDLVEVLLSDFGPNHTVYSITVATAKTFRFDAGAPVVPSSGGLTFVGKLHLSDRNKYVGGIFYESRLIFPIISRTIGELLAPDLEFSTLSLEINNADGFFNDMLPAGSNYAGWIDRAVTVRLGLRDVDSTYRSIFSGHVTNEGGFQRSIKSFTLIARNDFDRLNVEFPASVFTKDAFPNLGDDKVNVVVPVIYGDWTLNVEPDMASVPAIIVNEADGNVTGDGSPHSTNVQFVISDNDLALFDTTQVYVKRSSVVQVFDAGDIVNVGAGNKTFELRQEFTTPAGTTLFDSSAYNYERGDEIYVKVKGKALGGFDDNLVSQAMDVLETYAEVGVGDFTSAWATYRDKAAPAQSAISIFKSRIWIQEPQPVLTFALSLLEQVRLEAFVDRDGMLGLAALHFEDFVAAPSFKAKLWDIGEGSFNPKLDERNNFNRAQGVFNFLPNRKENFQETKILRNNSAIAQAGREISKKAIYPNLYDETTVQYQLTELLRLCSSYLENVYMTLTWRAMLLDIGDSIAIDFEIEGTKFENVPALIREIGYDPEGIKVPVRLFSFQMVPFPGWSPGFPGITGGYAATIDEE